MSVEVEPTFFCAVILLFVGCWGSDSGPVHARQHSTYTSDTTKMSLKNQLVRHYNLESIFYSIKRTWRLIVIIPALRAKAGGLFVQNQPRSHGETP